MQNAPVTFLAAAAAFLAPQKEPTSRSAHFCRLRPPVLGRNTDSLSGMARKRLRRNFLLFHVSDQALKFIKFYAIASVMSSEFSEDLV